MIVVVLMAGAGRRFADAAGRNPDYALPKPFIPVLGRPILEWTTRSLPCIRHAGDPEPDAAVPPEKLYFAVRTEDDTQRGAGHRLRACYGGAINIVRFDTLTRGNLETAAIVCRDLPRDEDVLFLDSDNAYDGAGVMTAIRAIRSSPSALICHFRPLDDAPKWCFAMIDAEGRVHALREKDPEALRQGGEPMVGTFYFDSVATFLDVADEIMASGERTGSAGAREFYMSQAVQRLIARGDAVHAHRVEDVNPLGTPEDVERFVQMRSNRE